MGKKSKRKIQGNPSYGNIVHENVSEVDQQTAQDAVSPNKRHKKHKKSKEDGQDIKESPAEDHVHTETQKTDSKKKKKKRKAIDDENVNGEDCKYPKSKKQKLQDENDIPENNSLLESTGATSAEVGATEAVTSENCVKKKKKKNHHKNRDDVVSMIPPTDNPVNGSVSEPERSLVIEVKTGDDSDTESSKLKKKKKKDKKKSKEVESANDESNSLESNTQGIVTHCCSEGKKRKREHREERTFPGHSTETKADDSKPKKKKKHKTKSELHVEDGQNELADGLQENDAPLEMKPESKKDKKKSKKDSESKSKETDELTDKTGVKKKKKDKKGKNGVNPAELTDSVCEEDSSRKEEKVSKKKKKSENSEERSETETAGNDETAEIEQKKKKKKKGKSKDKEQNSEQDATGDDDSRVCGIDAGTADLTPQNSFNINPDQTNDDPKQTCTDPRQTGTDPGLTQFPRTPSGQWGANLFKDSERQNKFLRLLGGFKKAGGDTTNAVTSGSKKGLFGSLQHKDTSIGGQKALTYQAAQAMNRRLESDYERALTFSVKGQRGIGLGFKPDPAEGKKFHIDMNKVASKTFD